MNRPLACLILLLLPTANLSGQTAPYRGVLWQRPESLAEAAADLYRMREAGVEAVRTGLIADDRLLTLADTLGLHLFQEIPVALLPAGRLSDALPIARPLVERILHQASAHASVRHVGLARRVDTTDPLACAYFEALARLADAAGADTAAVQVYYTSLFIEDDVCSAAVDLVLFDGLAAPNPEALARRWQSAHDTPLGLASAGRWVADAGPAGYRAPHSPEGQARYLEETLTAALDTPALYAVFVNRWRDTAAEAPSFAYDPLRPYARPFGLMTANDTLRPAFRVVRGMYTGEQTTFALPAGERPPPLDWSVPTLLGWALFLLLGVLYGQNVHFRDGLRRYFIAHGFYIETVSRGRDVDMVINGLLLTVFALAAGLVGTVLVHLLAAWPPLGLLMFWTPGRLDALVLQVLARPWVGILLFGALFALIQVLWAVGLSPLAGLHRRMSGPQHLMLVIWPRWPVLFLAAAALAVINLPPERLTPRAGLILMGVWLGTVIWARTRTLSDYALARRVPRIQVLATGLGLFVLVLGGLGLTLLFGGFWPEVEFLAHLALRE